MEVSTTTAPMETTMEGEKIQISLVLLPSYHSNNRESLVVPPEAIAVPSDTRRRGLSAIVNHLLDRRVLPTHAPSPSSDSDDSDSDSDSEKLPALAFDFLLKGRLLRASVESAARREGVSFESAVEIQYFPARDTPEGDGETEELPDWVTALSSGGGEGGFVCAGGSDGWLRFYGREGLNGRGAVKAHSGAIKAVAVGSGSEKGVQIIASGSMDQTLVTHRYRAGTDDGASQLELHAVYGNGHSSSIDALAMVGVDGNRFLASGDWGGGLCVWKVPGAEEAGESAATSGKRRKKGTDDAPITVRIGDDGPAVNEVTPLISLKAHSGDVAGIAWGHDTTSDSGDGARTLLTCSWDHSIKSWDVETQNNVLTLNGSKVATCLARCRNSDVVATGHPDRTVRLWDMRVQGKGGDGEGGFFDGTLRPSHSAWISSVEWSHDPYVLASASHDGTVKLWDIRSSLPLHTVRAHSKGKKALCLTVTEDAVYSGGSDCLVKKFKF